MSYLHRHFVDDILRQVIIGLSKDASKIPALTRRYIRFTRFNHGQRNLAIDAMGRLPVAKMGRLPAAKAEG